MIQFASAKVLEIMMDNNSEVRLRWLTAERLRFYPRLLLMAYLVLSAIWIGMSNNGVDITGKAIGQDFIVFWSASKLALDGNPMGVYDPATLAIVEHATLPGFDFLLPWQYPPTFLLLVLPLALLPYFVSCALFLGGSLAALLNLLRRIAPSGTGLALIAAFPGIFLNLFHGQNGLLTAVMIGSGLYWLPKRPWLAGAMFGLLTIKPHLGNL